LIGDERVVAGCDGQLQKWAESGIEFVVAVKTAGRFDRARENRALLNAERFDWLAEKKKLVEAKKRLTGRTKRSKTVNLPTTRR